MATATAIGGAIREVFSRLRDAGDGDGELLTRYRTLRDQDAFGSLVRRHGPMVLGVCRRVLRDTHAADDAFQATFLVLARKADCVRPPDRLAPWLYGVAYRTAMKSRGRACRRHQVELDYATQQAGHAPPPDDTGDLLPIIDEQLSALPEKYRVPLVLCGMQGLNKSEIAARLGLPEGTVSSRLARAREMLRDRLSRRGVVVPSATLSAILTADTLQAAVPHTLLTTTSSIALGSTATPAVVLTLSHEVIRSMTLLKLNFLGAIALAASLAGGGFGVHALQADDKKPEKPTIQKPAKEKPAKPRADREKPDKSRPAGEQRDKPRRQIKITGKVAGVDVDRRMISMVRQRDSGPSEEFIELAADAKLFIDGKPGELKNVPKDSTATVLLAPGTKDGEQPKIVDARITGDTIKGRVKEVGAASVTLGGERADRVVKVGKDATVTINGKAAKLASLKPGSPVVITLAAKGDEAITIVSGAAREREGDKPRPRGDGERPDKPRRPIRFGGKVAEVDSTAHTITLTTKGEAGLRETVIKLTADAKITVDGKAVKLADLPKGATATCNIVSAKDGQLREANEVTVAGISFGGTVKRIDATTITVGTEKNDRVLTLVEGGKVMIGEKEGKLADLKVGDRVRVTMTSDESAAVLIAITPARGDREKPRRDGDDKE